MHPFLAASLASNLTADRLTAAQKAADRPRRSRGAVAVERAEVGEIDGVVGGRAPDHDLARLRGGGVLHGGVAGGVSAAPECTTAGRPGAVGDDGVGEAGSKERVHGALSG